MEILTSLSKYQLEQFQDFIDSTEVEPGYLFAVKEDALLNGSILLMRFFIGKLIYISTIMLGTVNARVFSFSGHRAPPFNSVYKQLMISDASLDKLM